MNGPNADALAVDGKARIGAGVGLKSDNLDVRPPCDRTCENADVCTHINEKIPSLNDGKQSHEPPDFISPKTAAVSFSKSPEITIFADTVDGQVSPKQLDVFISVTVYA